jgi:acylphosphatase
MTDKTTTRAHVFVTGRVQGVNFRWYTQQQARELGLTGWVRNLWDGRVEAIFEGDEKAVQAAVNWCYQGQPPAQVDEVEVTYAPASDEFSGFQITW